MVEEHHRGSGSVEEGTGQVAPLDGDRIAEIARALAHPARLQIVAGFGQRGALGIRELSTGLALAPSTVSEHLRILRRAGILVRLDAGRPIGYRLSRAALTGFARAVEHLASPPVQSG